MRTQPFSVGQYVELSGKGLRYLKKKHPYGWVLAVQPGFAVKVKFEGSETEAEWFEPGWFQDAGRPTMSLSGTATPTPHAPR